MLFLVCALYCMAHIAHRPQGHTMRDVVQFSQETNQHVQSFQVARVQQSPQVHSQLYLMFHFKLNTVVQED